MSYKVVKDYIPKSKYSLKCPYTMTPIGITVHNTSNDATAKNEGDYMERNGAATSFHVVIDDKEVRIKIPFDRNAWHAGDGNSGKGNRKTIGIEICYSKSGGARFNNAEKNAAKYIASLMVQYKWDINDIYRHKDWSGKNCPHRTIQNGWNRFKKMIQTEYDKLTKKTCVILAGAMNDENRKYKGGQAGDQLQTSSTNDTKGELRLRDFYIHSKGWWGFRFISDEYAAKFIEAILEAIHNPNIGYDQNNRYDIMDMLKKYGSLGAIVEPTECVCSSLFRAAIYLATGIDLGPFLTGDMPELFEKSGLFKEKVVVTSEDDVEDGMILVTKTSGHTEAVVSGRPRTTSETFKPYKVKITAKTLNVRKGAGTKNKVVGVITADEKLIKKNPNYYFKKTTYTIVEEKMVGSNKWGRLKSGAGWIHLGYTKKV